MVRNSKNPDRTATTHAAEVAARHQGLIFAGIGGLILAVLLGDIGTPLGMAVWVFYLLPITLSLFLQRRLMPMLAAAICTLLMVIAFWTDAPGMNRAIAEVNRGFGILTFWIMAVVGYFYIANETIVRRQAWIDTGKAGLAQAMSGDLKPGEFGSHVLTYLIEFLGGQVGTFFVLHEDDFQRTATYGIPTAAMGVQHATADEGLLGQAIQSGRLFHFQDVPEGYLTVGSSLGHTNPRSLVIAPMKVADKVKAIVEIGFMTPVTQDTLEFLETICEPVGVAVASSRYRVHLQRLLAETRQQAEELQQQGEELRVSNEELEVQSQVLQRSQAQLEQQQVELEQSNVQLEDKTQLLRAQRDELAQATLATQAKAQELETTSRYKSDFLANMSHELRTPLNSSLILAKLLAENAQGNLTPEQVVSAETIHSAGNDLLLLINDILDLSKIEAGKMTVHPEAVWLADVVAELEKHTRPLTDQKGLELVTRIDANLPEQIVTDQQRLEQILKNLLSNAVKFTDQGKIELLLSSEGDNQIAIRVVDTGIGISPADQTAVFEAFRQVDSAANRKYNGTGLGLSITTELARILGGHVRLESELNRGSTFTLILPLQFSPTTASESAGPSSEQAGGSSTASSPADHTTTRLSPADLDKAMAAARGESEIAQSRSNPRQRKPIVDDREKLRGDQRIILIVEDDESFASILANVAHEMDFQCVIATTAQEAMVLAAQFLPQAILLDVGLPDETGLIVLDRLKQDARTRHIPVHVISANDFSETALALGAVGYAVKPVTREMLLETLQDLQTQLNQRTRRVLVVEDDEVQLASMQKLLASRDVETTGAKTVAECLERLKRTTFDCMVLDLSLPDSSGYSLLETLSQNDDYSFPPVIIYTGRELTAEQEHALRRYSKSIIIKGAKSPERLLDEVTLFLHQVVDELPEEQQQMIKKARSREAALEGRRILVVEDDVRNVFALTSILEPRGAIVQIARNGREALAAVEASTTDPESRIDLVLMDVMMPEMDGLTATQEIRKQPKFKNLPIIMLTAKAMKNDQLECLQAGANDYMAKPLDVDKLLSLVRVWIRNR